MSVTSPPTCNTNILLLSARSYYLCLAIFAAVMTAGTVILNTIFLAVIFSQKRIQKSISSKLLATLSMVDLLQGMCSWPLVTANFAIFHDFNKNCFLLDFNRLVGYRLATVTLTTILLLTLEQYIAIIHPYFFVSNVTFGRLIGPMLLANALLIVANVVVKVKLDQNWEDVYKIIVAAVTALMVMSLFYMHTKISRCASRVAVRISVTNKEEGKQIKTRSKAAKSGLVVLLATLLCYCPNICYIIYGKMSIPTPFITSYVQYPSEIFGLVSSVVDPIVYYWRLRSLRRATKDMFASLFKSRNKVEIISVQTPKRLLVLPISNTSPTNFSTP